MFRWIPFLLLLAFPGVGQSSPDCSQWLTGEFWKEAEDVKLCLAAGADVNARHNDGWTPLHLAAAHGTAKTVKAVLDAGADINARENVGLTPLHAATPYGTAENVNALLAAGADINARRKYC